MEYKIEMMKRRRGNYGGSREGGGGEGATIETANKETSH